MSTLGNQLRNRRKQAGLGLRTFAGMIDQRASTVSAIESGRRQMWRDDQTHQRIGQILGVNDCDPPESHPLAAMNGSSVERGGRLRWWWTTGDAATLTASEVAALAEFVSAEPVQLARKTEPSPQWPTLTELSIEWQVRKLLGKRDGHASPAPIDVEAVLEASADVQLEIVPGLIPHLSVQACAVECGTQTTIYVDRIVADSRPLSSYRELLASCYGISWLGEVTLTAGSGPEWFFELGQNGYLPLLARDCQRFALAMLLPAGPVLRAAEDAFRDLVEQQGWVELEEAARSVRNRLSEQFSVPPTLVQRRLTGWPCHLYGRIAQALAAEESSLPPADWLADVELPRQRTLFEMEIESEQ